MATTKTAATPIKIFLRSPLDSGSALPPPNENVGAADALDEDKTGLLVSASAAFSITASVVSTAGNGASATLASGTSRAGAGALAAPLLSDGPDSFNAGFSGLAVGEAEGLILADGATALCSPFISIGFLACAAALTAGLTVGGAIGRGGSADGLAVADGAVFAGEGVGAGVEAAWAAPGAAAFPGSPLRSNPRATRSVPLACSTLMGLVSTRFAPIRNALATPA